ncbi:MAG: LTA synthase family protein [Paludibacteraceae bacterium]
MGSRRAIWNIVLLMVIYSLSRLFFFLINSDLYPEVGTARLWEMMLGGMRFDLTAVLYLSSVYLVLALLPLPLPVRNHRVYQLVTRLFYLIPNALGILVNCVDMVYVRFTDRRTTCTFFIEFRHDTNLGTILWQSLWQYWYVTLFAIAALCLLIFCSAKPLPVRYPALPRLNTQRSLLNPRLFYYVRETLLLCLIAYFTVIGIRGGFGRYTRPITISNALQYADRPQETAIILNTPFSLMKSLENETYQNPHYFAQEDLESIMSPVHLPSAAAQEKRLNVVVLILESFSKEYIGFYNNPPLKKGTGRVPYTPFLDSLLAQSVTYTYSYASGRKSIDAMPSVLSSIPMLIEPYVVTPYSTNSVSSIADCLNRKGYTTAFFHGAPNGSMGFQAYARSAGFGRYYGMNEYTGEDAFDGTWAIWDEEFLQFFAHTMDTLSQPFMTAVFTASSHHPFKIPARYEGRFPKGTIPLHQCIGYADYALRRFFDYASQQPWFENTLFVLTADHTNQLTLPEYQNTRGLFAVPIAFYCPAQLTPDVREQSAVSQTDIMPSVLNFVGYDEPYFAFGEDCLTQEKAHPWAVIYNHPVFEVLSPDAELVLDELPPATEEEEAMLRYLKAYIQQYIDRMITDRLTVENGSSSR